MNGMTSRLEAVRQIITSLKIERIVETGTFRGTTAEWFAQFGLPFETVEISERYYTFSKERLRRFANAQIFFDASVPFLHKRLADRKVAPDTRQLFYLDSHWKKHLPLREEIELIFNNYTKSVVVIDDFEVADDRGYSFDAYSDSDQLTMSYLATANVPRRMHYFYPSTRSDDETGMKRGWLVTTDDVDIAKLLDQIHLLRRATGQSKSQS